MTEGPTPLALKPRLRGVLHLISFPVSAVLGIILVSLARSTTAKIACGVYALGMAELFGVSALYHRGRWSPRVWLWMKRWDHADIYIAIAASYTPISLILLHGAAAMAVLSFVWAGAIFGVVLSLCWPHAPRAVLVPTYGVVGWAAVFVLPEILQRGGVAIMVLTLAGGVLYTIGGVIFALRKPDPSPRYFGFHEVFHSFTVVAWVVQYVAISMAAYRF